MSEELKPEIIGAPEEIFLCLGELEIDAEGEIIDFARLALWEGVSWCEAQQDPFDIRYVRADIPDPRLSQAVALLRGALSKVVATVPAQDGGGGFIFEHHGIDGEYLGSQPIDPMWIIQEMASIAQNAIADFDTQQQPTNGR